MSVKEIDDLLSGFALDLRTRNKLRNVILHLRKHGKTVDEFIDYADKKVELHLSGEDRAQRIKESSFPICSECGTVMSTILVNTRPENQTGDGSKIVSTCINRECLHQIFE